MWVRWHKGRKKREVLEVYQRTKKRLEGDYTIEGQRKRGRKAKGCLI